MCYKLLDTGRRTAIENIALDAALLEARTKDEIPNTLRLLQFSPPAVLVGFHQTIEQEVRVEFCKQRGIDINRRITGGGAIYFDESQLGWELVAKKADFGYHLDKITKKVCQAICCGLRRLGVDAQFRPRNDIEVNGRKISGTGGIFEDSAVLFQGTLLVDFDVDTMMRALRIPTEKLADKELESVRQRVTCLREELGEVPPLKKIKHVLQEGFEEILGVRFEKMELPEYVQHLFEQKKTEFASDVWIESARESLNLRQTLQASYKAKGGIIRVSLVVDVKRKLVKQSLITGDFFISPTRTIFDLEVELKDVPCGEVSQRIERFFESRQPQMPGLTYWDFVRVFSSALEKIEYPEMGIPLEETNYLFTVNGKLCDILKFPSVLLLPYCAKRVGCEYRYNGGCSKCGQCSVGTAYELAEERGLTPITIRNYEHLRATLKRCKDDGVKSYIGCCCESFFVKRQRMFREIGIPGVLIDIENRTCYDLDKETEALAGKFENQTELKLGLLKKVINYANNL
jgi:lipoate-protein ligase A